MTVSGYVFTLHSFFPHRAQNCSRI